MDVVVSIIAKLVNIYQWALIIYIFMSWFPNARDTAIGQFLARICEPFLEPFRRIVPSIGMIDISPIVAFLVLRFAVNGLYQLAAWF
jgi:YggT family protein